jgi:hypothetical protein
MAIIFLSPRAQTSGIEDGAPQQKFDLSVETTQVVPRPTLQRVVELRVDSEQEGASVRHEPSVSYW